MNPNNAPPADKRTDALTGCALGLIILFVAEVVVGLLLELRYTATSADAYKSVQAMPSMLRGFHYWSSAILIAGGLLALVWMALKRRFGREWLGVTLLFLASLFSQLTGNLLPFDRHGVQTAVVEAGVARQMPGAGSVTTGLMLNGERFNESTLGRWHVAHIGFFVLGIVGAWLFLAATREERKNRVFALIPVALAVLGLVIAAPLGAPATPADYGSFDAAVSWYTWPMHGSLNLFSRLSPNLGWIGSGVIPGLFVLVLLSAPIVSRRFSPKLVQGAFFGIIAFFLVSAILFGGGFASLTGNRDPVAATVVTPTAAPPVDQVLFSKGRDLFGSKGCADCHGKDGKGGASGPSLLGIAQRRGSDPAWYARFIHDPSSVKPNSMMPAFPDLTTDETRAIAEFLIHQK